MSNDTYQFKCGGAKAYKKGESLASGCCPSLKNAAELYLATKASRIPPNLNFPGETEFFWEFSV